MARAQGQLEAEMQNLEEEKNRVIEDAFIRAESEMKAVHKNLAGERLHPALCECGSGFVCVPSKSCRLSLGVRLNLLSLQPALRTLTSDYNCVKKQVQDFPFMLDKAISEAKQEVRELLLHLQLWGSLLGMSV